MSVVILALIFAGACLIDSPIGLVLIGVAVILAVAK
jgi:hypothetical protein